MKLLVISAAVLWCGHCLRPPSVARVVKASACYGKTRGDRSAAPPVEPEDEDLKEMPSVVDEVVGDVLEESSKDASELTIGELTAELDLRGVDYSDCVEADELRSKLTEARLSGRADPALIDKFNRNRAEAMMDPTKAVDPTKLTAEELEAIKGADGGVPGGLAPEEIFKLMNDPKIMTMLQKPKFQEIMKDAMGGGGQAAIQRHMVDPESREMLLTLTSLLKDAGMVPPQT